MTTSVTVAWSAVLTWSICKHAWLWGLDKGLCLLCYLWVDNRGRVEISVELCLVVAEHDGGRTSAG